MEFIRLGEAVHKKKNMRVVSVTVIPTVANCSGTIWFTDIQLQEGANITGYVPHTQVMVRKHRENGNIKPMVFYNSLVRNKETVVIPNMGKTSAPLDIRIYSKDDMAAGALKLSQGVGGQKSSYPGAISEDDEIDILARERICSKNGVPFTKEGFFQYSAAWDSKHNVEVDKGKSVRLLIELQEMDDGGVAF